MNNVIVKDQDWYKHYSTLALSKIEAVLSTLGVEHKINNRGIAEIVCPIHNSDKIGNSIIYLDTGVWLCFSGNCHHDYGKNILGLIKGTLKKNNEDDSWESVKNIIDGQSVVSNIIIPKKDNIEIFKDEKTKPCSSVPSIFYIKKGYSEKILIDYEVGDCYKGFCSNKAIVPIRYINNEYMGYSARSHWSECKACGYHHSKYETCINKNHEFNFMYKKWYHCKGLQKSKTLYGINKIKNTNKVALVEGAGCVWKLAEHDIQAVACLGKDIDDHRVNLLKNIGIKKVLFIPDNDEAGKEFRNRFIMKYHDKLEIRLPKLTAKDVGEMSNDDIVRYIKSVWETF